MKIALLAQRHSIHTVRWANALAERKYEVYILSSVGKGEPLNPMVKVIRLPVPSPIGYFLNALSVRRALNTIQPNVLHAHFASGYGTLAALARYTPTILSVWGSDVYEFPTRSPLHQMLVKRNLRAADIICSTSVAMAEQCRVYSDHLDPYVVPFGIDTSIFKPAENHSAKRYITIGTVKTLDNRYGIDLLLEAFAMLRNSIHIQDPSVADRLRLLIVGGGPDEGKLRSLASTLGIASVTEFRGAVPHRQVPVTLHELDVYVALSRFESFGVAVLEASASGLPVVVSSVGGLPEVVRDQVTGFVVGGDVVSGAAHRLQELVLRPRLRTVLGEAGRMFVSENYSWERSVDQMEAVYKKAVS